MPSAPADPRPNAERLRLLIERTARLHRITAALSGALTRDGVADIVVDEGTEALGALTGALWEVDSGHGELVLMRARNYPDDARRGVERIQLDPEYPIAHAVVQRKPVWLSSRADYETRYPVSAARTAGMIAEHMYSIAALPIVLRDVPVAVIALTFPGERGFDEDDRSYLQFLAVHCAQGFERARLYEVERATRERMTFLASASAVLGASLEYEETLANVAKLAVPTVGDWFGVDLSDADGQPKQVAVGHIDPAKIELARELRRRYPPNPAATGGFFNVMRTGRSELYAEITDEMISATARDAEHAMLIRELGLQSMMIVAIPDHDRIFGALTFVRSDKKRPYTADDVLMAEQLAHRLGAAISNALLYGAARDAVRARDEFMIVAGHELRTPLAALLLHHEALHRLKDDTPIETVRARGEKLLAQTARLSRLVEDLLDVSRISAGRLTLDRQDVDLAEIVRDAMGRMQEQFDKARCTVSIDLVEVRGCWDASRLDQVVTNLLSNAAKYGKGTHITVTVRRSELNATVEVRDGGIGIALSDQTRIFQRFERVASLRKITGLGLGLWISGELVRAHGGSIAVESEPAKGALFSVTLPLEPT